MVSRMVPLCLVALAVALCVGAPILAADRAADDTGNTHDGKVVSVAGNKLIMVDKSGKNEHTHTLAADAAVTCNGKECKLSDLKPGMRIRVTTSADKKVTKLEAFKGTNTGGRENR